MSKLMCVIREGLQEDGVIALIGTLYYLGLEPLEYRWINEGQKNEQFQVFFKGKWLDACSIDFDFLN